MHASTLLLVDDEAINLMALKSALRRNFEVHTALSGEEACKLLEQLRVDAIVSDQKMPGMSGTELFAYCRNKGIPGRRIMLTGYDDDAVIRQALEDGLVEAALSKPLRLRELLSLLEAPA